MEVTLHPGTQLAIARTVLANERSLLAIVRTALGCFIGGAGFFLLSLVDLKSID